MTENEFETRLEEMLEEAEETVRRLRSELKTIRAQAEETSLAAQHREIEQLEKHLEESKVDWAKVRAFFEDAIREVRETRAAKKAAR